MTPISVQNVSKKFQTTLALDNVSLEIPAGDIFFLLGPSGCGKTTLLRSIAGFISPDAGKIFFASQEMTSLPPHRRHTGMVFQNYALFPHLNVAQNVSFGLEEQKISKNETRERTHAALASVQMDHLADRKITQLSGGQQQRVALARALVIRPKCLLLDEPLSNLDTQLRIEMRSEIRRICKESGLTALYVTHDQKEALSIADKIAVMRNGRIIQATTPTELYHHPADTEIASFIGEANLTSGTVLSLSPLTIQLSPDKTIQGRPANPNLNFQMNDSVRVMIRPEAFFQSGKSLSPAENTETLDGTILQQTFLGELVQFQVDFGFSTPFSVWQLNPGPNPSTPGTRASFHVQPSDILIFPK